MRIVFMGAIPTYGWGETRELSEQEAPFVRAAHDLGYEAARRGHTVMLGDDHRASVDAGVMAGITTYLAEDPGHRAEVVINRTEGSRDIYPDLGDQVTVRRRFHPELDLEHGGSWSLIPNLAALDTADVAIMAGGRTTTRLMGNIGADRGEVVAIPSFGGAAFELYGRLRYAYRAKVSEDHPGIAALNAIWSASSAPSILDLAEVLGGATTATVPHSYFMSYTWSSSSIADHVEALLLRNGRRVLRDESMFAAGADLSGSVKSMIAEADTYIALYNEAFANSSWCPGELAFATERKRRGEKPHRVVCLALDTYDPQDLPMQHLANLWKPGKERSERDLAIRKLLEQEPT
jgi:hypothetical protein